VSVRLFEFGDVPIGFFPYWLDEVNNIFQYQVGRACGSPKHWWGIGLIDVDGGCSKGKRTR
jgi:hypothetical protein